MTAASCAVVARRSSPVVPPSHRRAACSARRAAGPQPGRHPTAPATVGPTRLRPPAVFAQCVPRHARYARPDLCAGNAQPADRAAAASPPGRIRRPVPLAQDPATRRKALAHGHRAVRPGQRKLSRAARSQLNRPWATAATCAASRSSAAPIARAVGVQPESLALARALAVRDHLRKTHPTLAATLTLRRGACCFIAPNDTLAGRAQNRRAEVVFPDERGPAMTPGRSPEDIEVLHPSSARAPHPPAPHTPTRLPYPRSTLNPCPEVS